MLHIFIKQACEAFNFQNIKKKLYWESMCFWKADIILNCVDVVSNVFQIMTSWPSKLYLKVSMDSKEWWYERSFLISFSSEYYIKSNFSQKKIKQASFL